jgi:uncharacterized protein YihD (DUF1040 family)
MQIISCLLKDNISILCSLNKITHNIVIYELDRRKSNKIKRIMGQR